MTEQQQRDLDKAYKEVFVHFIKSKEWHWFITIPIGLCDDDDVVLKRLRAIEAAFCGKYLVNRYQKLPDEARFSMVVAFESDAKAWKPARSYSRLHPTPVETTDIPSNDDQSFSVGVSVFVEENLLILGA